MARGSRQAPVKNEFEMPCRVCGVTDDGLGEDVLEPDGYDLEWVHHACLPHPITEAAPWPVTGRWRTTARL